MVITPWTPIYKGMSTRLNKLSGLNHYAISSGAFRLKDALSDTARTFSSSPHRKSLTIWPTAAKPLSASITTFVRRYGVDVATMRIFTTLLRGFSDPAAKASVQFYGLSISKGEIFSAPDSTRRATLLLTSNNVPSFAFKTSPPEPTLREFLPPSQGITQSSPMG